MVRKASGHLPVMRPAPERYRTWEGDRTEMADTRVSTDNPGDLSAAGLAQQWREVRTAAIEVASTLPETRAYRNMERAGWTFKHELSHFAALDAEVTHLLDATRRGLTEGLDATSLRRRRGEAMHAALSMRLLPLREHLAEAGEETARAIEEAGDALSAALTGALADAGGEARDVAGHIRSRLAQAEAGVQALRSALGA